MAGGERDVGNKYISHPYPLLVSLHMKQVAINNYLLKIASFCNLNCSYCFMFNLQDTTYRGKEKIMPLEIVQLAAKKMVELARQQEITMLHVSFHGGEPLLAGKDWFRRAVTIIKEASGGDVAFKFGLQTNAVLIDDEWLDLFAENGVSVGVSLDGPRHINDRARLNFAGDSSYDKTVAGLTKLLERRLLSGVLCVIDPTADGLEIYRHFRALNIKWIDFLWPLDFNWNSPPPSVMVANQTPYADYLIPIFDEWWYRDKSSEIHIRYFEGILRGLVGAKAGLDSLGANPINIVTIDTDGSIEPLDSLRADDDGFTDVGLRIQRDPLSAIYEKELFQIALSGRNGLCEKCKSCALVDTCGGGYLPHRYSRTNGFDNPSIYCRDLWKLINHILAVVIAEVEKPFMEAPSSLTLEEPKPEAVDA